MRQNQKRALYESIMKNVGKTVKQALNEVSTETLVSALNKSIRQACYNDQNARDCWWNDCINDFNITYNQHAVRGKLQQELCDLYAYVQYYLSKKDQQIKEQHFLDYSQKYPDFDKFVEKWKNLWPSYNDFKNKQKKERQITSFKNALNQRYQKRYKPGSSSNIMEDFFYFLLKLNRKMPYKYTLYGMEGSQLRPKDYATWMHMASGGSLEIATSDDDILNIYKYNGSVEGTEWDAIAWNICHQIEGSYRKSEYIEFEIPIDESNYEHVKEVFMHAQDDLL